MTGNTATPPTTAATSSTATTSSTTATTPPTIATTPPTIATTPPTIATTPPTIATTPPTIAATSSTTVRAASATTTLTLSRASREQGLKRGELDLAIRLGRVPTVHDTGGGRVAREEIERLRAEEGFPDGLRERVEAVGTKDGAAVLQVPESRFTPLARLGLRTANGPVCRPAPDTTAPDQSANAADRQRGLRGRLRRRGTGALTAP